MGNGGLSSPKPCSSGVGQSDEEVDNVMTKYVSTQIINPLNAAFSTLQLIQDGLHVNADHVSHIMRTESIGEDDETLGLQRMTIDAKVSCLNAMRIIENVTTYERLMRNLMILKPRLCTLKGEVDDTLSLHHFYIKASGIDVISEINPDITLTADNFQLRNAISALIFNALKVTPDDAFVVISAHQVLSNSEEWNPESSTSEFQPSVGYVRIGITDSGPGLTTKQTDGLKNHWEHFLSPELHESQGYDLGIWVSNRIMTMTGGKIGVYSAGRGFGSTFYIEVPLLDIDSSKPSSSKK